MVAVWASQATGVLRERPFPHVRYHTLGKKLKDIFVFSINDAPPGHVLTKGGMEADDPIRYQPIHHLKASEIIAILAVGEDHHLPLLEVLLTERFGSRITLRWLADEMPRCESAESLLQKPP